MVQPREFHMDEPFEVAGLATFYLYTGRDDLAEIARTFKGFMDVEMYKLRSDEWTMRLHISPRFDADVVWLELYEALERASKFTGTWSDAIDDLNMQDI